MSVLAARCRLQNRKRSGVVVIDLFAPDHFLSDVCGVAWSSRLAG